MVTHVFLEPRSQSQAPSHTTPIGVSDQESNNINRSTDVSRAQKSKALLPLSQNECPISRSFLSQNDCPIICMPRD